MLKTTAFYPVMLKRHSIEMNDLIYLMHSVNMDVLNFVSGLNYCEPSAEVVTDNLTSEPFSLSRGTHQGCPLSPMLFVLTLEPLAIAIRNHPGIKGINISGQEHRIFLFANEILLYPSDLKKYNTNSD